MDLSVKSKIDSGGLNSDQIDYFNRLISETENDFREYKWNVYDYEDPDLIQKLSNFSDDEFQWEFIRRNEVYRRLWLASERKIHFKGAYAPADRIAEDVFSLVYFANPNIGSLDLAELARRWKPTEEDFFRPSFTGHVSFKRNQRQWRISYFRETEQLPRLEKISQFYMKFDGALNHTDQINYAREFLRLHSKNTPDTRSHRIAWPEYIRVLDAHAAGLSYKQIGLLLRKSRNEQSARDSLEAGRRLVFRCATVL